MANRARDWSSPRQAPPPSFPSPQRDADARRCLEHGIILLENGSEGRYLCPQCVQHLWEETHGSEAAWNSALIFPKLYGRNHRVSKRTPLDLRPHSAWTYRQLRTRVRAYAKTVLRIRGAGQMDLEPLLPFIGKTPGEQWERLQGFERRALRKSP